MLSKKIGMLFTFLDSALLPQLLNGLYGEGGDGVIVIQLLATVIVLYAVITTFALIASMVLSDYLPDWFETLTDILASGLINVIAPVICVGIILGIAAMLLVLIWM